MSDLYFCKNCCLGWYDNKWMMCCKGCVGHKESGWSLKDMQTTYGLAMKELIKQQTSPKQSLQLSSLNHLTHHYKSTPSANIRDIA